MATLMTFASGKYVAVGMAGKAGWGAEGVVAPPSCGLGMSTTAMKGRVGVTGAALLDAQPENSSTHKDRMKKR